MPTPCAFKLESSWKSSAAFSACPPYVFNITGEMKIAARRRGEDIIDFGMGNPDGATPKHIVDKLIERRSSPRRIATRVSKRHSAPAQGHLQLVQDPLRRRSRPRHRGHRHHRLQRGHRPPLPRHSRLATTPCWCPTPATPSTSTARSSPARTSSAFPSTTASSSSPQLEELIPRMTPRPKALIVNFPSNPTTECVELPFLARLVELAREYGFHLIHDLAYADIAFDGYKPPSVLRSPAQKTSPSSSSPCPRATTCPAGASASWSATRSSSPPSPASRATSTTAPSRPSRSPPSPRSKARRSASHEICEIYRKPPRRPRRRPQQARLARRPRPRPPCSSGRRSPSSTASWARWSSQSCCSPKPKPPSSPGIGFGDYGDGHVRFALIENEERTRQALRGIKQMFAKG